MTNVQGLKAAQSGMVLVLLLVTPLLLVAGQSDVTETGPLASSGASAVMQPLPPVNRMSAQTAASVVQQDESDTAVVAAGKPVPTTRAKVLRMAAAAAAAERRDAASAPFAASAAAVPAAASDGSITGLGVGAYQDGTYQAIFDRHNVYRATHQAAALTWSSTLASQAATYAAGCKFAHDPNANAGENLFATSDTSNPSGALTQAIQLWYDEVRLYNFNNPGFSSATGHFTQVVWRSSSSIGCAVKTCSNGMGGTGWQRGSLVVCRYSPAGNVLGNFQANVLPASSNPPPVTPPPVNPPPVNPPTNPPPVIQPPPSLPPTTPPPANPPPTGPVPPATLPSGYKFASPGCLYSASQRSRLCMEDSGYAVLYANGIPGTAVWVSKNTMSSVFRPYKLSLGTDGNLAVIDSLNRVLWQTGTQRRGTGPYRMVVQDDGVAALFDAFNARIWASSGMR